MKSAAYRSFGLLAVITTFEKNDVIVMEPIINNVYEVTPNFGYVWMYLKGNDILENIATGEKIERGPGDNLINNPLPVGSWRTLIPEDIQVVCYSPFVNHTMLPLVEHLEPVVLAANDSRMMPHMTQFFLAAGSIQANDKKITGPNQVCFKTSDTNITALDSVYGFIVK